jgi:hypothetical protein
MAQWLGSVSSGSDSASTARPTAVTAALICSKLEGASGGCIRICKSTLAAELWTQTREMVEQHRDAIAVVTPTDCELYVLDTTLLLPNFTNLVGTANRTSVALVGNSY